MQAVIDLLRSGELPSKYRGLIYVREQDDLVLLNYTPECQYSNAWDEVTTWCRGLIIDTHDWTVVAHPFRKFFNMGERPESSVENLPSLPFSVYAKLDGSLGIMYRDRNGMPMLATRGAFASDQAVRGTAMLQELKCVAEVPNELTLLFEIIYHDNKSAIKYDYEGLVLLSVFDRFTGQELSWDSVKDLADQLGVRVPTVHSFESITDAASSAKQLPADLEGYVVRFANGFRVKLKGDAFLEIHRLVWGSNEKTVYQALLEGRFDDLLGKLPAEHRPDIERVAQPMIDQASLLRHTTEEAFAKAPKATRKEFAIWVNEHVTGTAKGAMFQLLDGRELSWYSFIK